MKTKLQQFERAYLDFEKLNIGGFDAFQHTSVKDLWWLVRHELDLYEEGEENDFTSKDFLEQLDKTKAARKYLLKWGTAKFRRIFKNEFGGK
jgi:hypothetical protein